MKTAQVFFLLWVFTDYTHAAKSSRKTKDSYASASRQSHVRVKAVPQEQAGMATAYVLTSAVPEAKVDMHQYLLQQVEAENAQAYAAALAGHTHASHFTPEDAVDSSKYYAVKTVKAYVPYEQSHQHQHYQAQPSPHHVESPQSYVYATGEPSAQHGATPLALTQAVYAGSGGDHSEHTDAYASKYKFGYRVSDPHTGSDFGHSEVKEGHVTKGHYHVLLPDGRLQNVKYWAGPSGYHATVTYEGTKYYH